MKYLKLLVISTIICSLIIVEACDRKKQEDKTLIKERTDFLVNKATWTAQIVDVPANSATTPDDWEGVFTVRFSETNMTTSNAPTGATAVWPSGQWSFKDENADIIVRGDGIEMTVLTITENSFQVQFTYNPGGRTNTIEGPYTFDFD